MRCGAGVEERGGGRREYAHRSLVAIRQGALQPSPPLMQPRTGDVRGRGSTAAQQKGYGTRTHVP